MRVIEAFYEGCVRVAKGCFSVDFARSTRAL